jgi:hypothetical protein
MKRKIAILTTPLFYNYGGILQCYALLSTLKNRGYEVEVIDIHYKKQDIIDIIKSIIKGFIKKYLFRKENITVYDSALLTKNKNIIRQNLIPFIEKNITPKTPPIYGIKDLKNKNEILSDVDIFIVGSDQIWRPMYCDVNTYFLGFIKSNHPIKRMSYAASFGVDNWEFSDVQTNIAQQLIKKFDAVSVREKSALKLCEQYLKVNAIQVLDPTMLLDKSDYVKLIDTPQCINSTLMAYVLDIDEEKKDIIDFVSDKTNMVPFFSNNLNTEKSFLSATERIVPSIESWLNGFMNANYVVTDSFHGTVFSILFNIPFITYGNKDRGLSRFTSLLEIFNLNERLIVSKDELTESKILKPIDWSSVNAILEKERIKSFTFLKNILDK